ncbi:MAG: 9-O-acetylesterase [Bacteroidetes bacterium GWE2_41_25]|nr:MAG: 9-O-acetylesterase [Bacteroidetes bacterium GWE2_41_25]OFY56922.1 MAG: 9-O-acetylesterase [Bacteroidetes bacterium GWF2_41_9]HBH84653.1 sialate O-acetylesterase [Bacteroidales bacterium]HCU18464.1 sialate O-acetylesterase [Bacteroidales bacterium]
MKRNYSFLTALLLVSFMITGNLNAQVILPAIFSDNMVLQQQTDVAIWGTASNNSTVKVTTSWNKKSYSTKAGSDGRWKLKVSTPSAGGPYEVTISEGNTIKFKNVLIGEVWVCSGQSNMEMPMKGYMNQPILGSNEAIATSSNPMIRLFTVTKASNLNPQDDFIGTWKNCEPENVSQFSATAYFFGLMLNKSLNVPIGLINSSWGGTRIEPWISEAGVKKFEFVTLPDKNQTGTLSPQTPTVLFNAMINPMAGYGIKGAIWYQGESNRNEPDRYEKLLPGMVENWRSLWGLGDFPFYYVQIAPFNYGPVGVNSAYLREAQLKASSAIKNIGMACIMDISEEYCIHPADKKAGGDRLAYQALVKTYGKKGFAAEGPVLKEMLIEGQIVKLSFDNAVNGLTSFGKELSCFEVAGANKRFYPATAFFNNAGISLFSQYVNEPVAVRYAFQDYIIGDLFNTEGLPASSFRTDDWPVE